MNTATIKSVASVVFGTDGTRVEQLSYIVYTGYRLGYKTEQLAPFFMSLGYDYNELEEAALKVHKEFQYFGGRWLLYYPDNAVGDSCLN